MKINSRKTLLFIGDSITDCGREKPLGQGVWGLGNGYVSLVDALLGARYPERKIRVLNTGIGGNRVIDLARRWEQDALAHKPHWLSIKIGINDVWQQFSTDRNHRQVFLEEYRTVLDSLIQKSLPWVEGLILMTPYHLEPNPSDPRRKIILQFGEAVKELANKHNAVCVDTQAAFDEYLRHNSWKTLCDDQVHVNTTGHMILARAFLDALEFSWNP